MSGTLAALLGLSAGLTFFALVLLAGVCAADLWDWWKARR